MTFGQAFHWTDEQPVGITPATDAEDAYKCILDSGLWPGRQRAPGRTPGLSLH